MKHINTIFFASVLMTVVACSKSDFLNEKPQKSILTPSSLDDLQALLDRDDIMNGLSSQGLTPQLGESGSDNIYLLDANFNTNLRPQMQNYYTWNATPYDGVRVLDWEYPYRAILYANSALEGVEEFTETYLNKDKINAIRGQALFHRAHMYHQLSQIFAPLYERDGDNQKRGLPIRLSVDINEELHLSTVQETYDLILADLKTAVPLLKTDNPYKHRPSRQAAYALLARVYLTMQDYPQAKSYADSCLAIQGDLVDYNTINLSVGYPFGGGYNSPAAKEVIFLSALLSSQSANYPLTYNNALIDSALYISYDINDLRRLAFFQARPVGYRFKGTYALFSAQNLYFSGLAVDEILLIRAECLARAGETATALADLTTLLKARWNNNVTFPAYQDLDTEETLHIILEERRKELLYRGLRWSDLRRLNQEGYDITLIRSINGQKYSLPPDDPRWVWPFPPEIIIK